MATCCQFQILFSFICQLTFSVTQMKIVTRCILSIQEQKKIKKITLKCSINKFISIHSDCQLTNFRTLIPSIQVNVCFHEEDVGSYFWQKQPDEPPAPLDSFKEKLLICGHQKDFNTIIIFRYSIINMAHSPTHKHNL